MLDEKEKNERLWGMFCHLSALSFLIGIPFGHILGPLIIWLVKKNESPLIDEQGKESLNFQISMSIYLIVAFLLCFIIIGIPLLFGLVLAEIILVIIAAVKTNNGEQYSYPITIRFIK
ncbi:MAG: DUF4870 domain-containing protein [Candidatus Aureabacteria bacterium]|nr:DUF4870 domain-containing protein [Candidatus Auribacterota bacterium]